MIHGYKEAQLVCKLCVSKPSIRTYNPISSPSVSPGFSVIPTAYAPPQELPQQARVNAAAQGPLVLNDPWMCRKCSFRNHASAANCSVCAAHRPLHPHVPLIASCGNCNSTLTGASGSRTKCPQCFCVIVFPSVVEPPAISQPIGASVPLSDALWDCEACTYVNSAMFGRCEMCNASPPSVNSWNCRECTYENAWEKTSCEMCHTARPAPQIAYILRQANLPAQPTPLTQEEKDLQYALSESMKELDALNEKEARLAREYEEALARVLEASEQSERRRAERERADLELKEANRLREQREIDVVEFKQVPPNIEQEAQVERDLEREQKERRSRQEKEMLELERTEAEKQAKIRREEEEKADQETSRRAQEDLEKRMRELTELRQEQRRRLKELAAKSEEESNDMLSQWRNEAGVQKVSEPAEEVQVHIPKEEQKVVQTEQQERRQALETLYQHIGESKQALKEFMSQSSRFKKNELSSEQYADIIMRTFPEDSLRTVVPLLIRELSTKNRGLALNLKEALRARLNV